VRKFKGFFFLKCEKMMVVIFWVLKFAIETLGR